MITAGHDPLREQDLDYLKKLEDSGVDVVLLDYPTMVHGFFTLPGFFFQGREAIEESARIFDYCNPISTLRPKLRNRIIIGYGRNNGPYCFQSQQIPDRE